MTVEMDGMFGGKGEPDYAEHSRPSSSKKVIQGPTAIAPDPAAPGKSINPIVGAVSAVSASLTLLRGKCYRVISSVAVNFRMTNGVGTAVATDIYLPANTPIYLTTDRWETLSAIAAGAGSIQAVEVE